ncbi:MAG: DUF1573 domain-containing protein [Hyphomicrobiales bacterium]
MKRLLVTLTMIFFAFVAVQAQNTNNEDKKDNPNAPVITFKKTVHDYGTISQGDNGKCEFKFTNTGKEPLILSKPRSSCGCTVPEWPKQPILPGQSEKIDVTYNTNRVGPVNKSVTIYSNASNDRVVIRIKGKVNPKVAEIVPQNNTDKSATPIAN